MMNGEDEYRQVLIDEILESRAKMYVKLRRPEEVVESPYLMMSYMESYPSMFPSILDQLSTEMLESLSTVEFHAHDYERVVFIFKYGFHLQPLTGSWFVDTLDGEVTLTQYIQISDRY